MKSKSKTPAITLLAAALLAAGFAGCGGRGPRVDPRIADPSRPLVFLACLTTPPSCWRNEAGDVVGEDVDLARRIAGRMGRRLKVETAAFEDILPRLKAGTADFSIAMIAITEARRQDMDFSEPYAIDGNCFLYRAKGPRPRMSQIASFRIGTETSTMADTYLCNHGADPVRFARVADAVAALERGEVDAVFFDAAPLRGLAERSGGRLVASPLETREGYGVAVDKRRPDVLAAANAVIAEGKGVSE